MNFVTYINLNQELKTIPLAVNGSLYSTFEIDEDYLVTAVYLNDIRQFVSNIQSSMIQIAVINEPVFDGNLINKKDYNIKGTNFSFDVADSKPLNELQKEIQKVDIVESHKTLSVEVINFPLQNGGGGGGNSEPQRDNEYLYFKEYLKEQFPNNVFVIKPYRNNFSGNLEFGYSMISYVKHSYSINDVWYYPNINGNGGHRPMVGFYSIANKFFSIEDICVTGYVAVSQTEIFPRPPVYQSK